MESIFKLSKLVLALIILMFSNFLNAQLSVSPVVSVQNVVEKYFKRTGDQISNVIYFGDSVLGLAEFYEPSGNLEMWSGIFLSTGPVKSALGPNKFTAAGIGGSSGDGILYGVGGSLLSALDTTSINDVQRIHFDFISASSTLIFEYVFASDEYLESIGSRFNDRIGIFISGPGIIGDSNIAVLNGDYISINTVHPAISNSNGNFNERNGDFYKTNSGSYMEFDGFTKKLYTVLHVQPGQTYRFKIMIGDGFDSAVNSGLFIRRCFAFCETGIEEENNIQFSISPNPSNGNFKVNFSNHQDGQLKITDLTGRIIHIKDINSDTNAYHLENISSGVYTLTFESEDGFKSERIVVE